MARHSRFFAVLAALAALVGSSVPRMSAQQPAVFTPGGSLPILDAYLEGFRQQAGIPGMSAAVAVEGQIIWEKGYGFQNLTTRERATPDTPYLVGDMSGTLAAILLLQCVEQRRVGLDEPLSRYGLSNPEADATLRGLLSHTGAPNSKDFFTYNSERYDSLTGLMEWCAPQPYRKSVAHRILNRLSMRDSVPGTDLIDPDFVLPDGLFADDDVQRWRGTLARMAVPYKVTGRTRADRTELPVIPMSAANGLVSTVRDLNNLDRSLETDMLLPETLALAWSQTPDRSGSATPMGLGWFVQFVRGERVVWHFGSVPNAYSSLIVKLPVKKVTFFLLANSDGLSAPYNLPAGDVTRSLFANLFLKLTT